MHEFSVYPGQMSYDTEKDNTPKLLEAPFLLLNLFSRVLLFFGGI